MNPRKRLLRVILAAIFLLSSISPLLSPVRLTVRNDTYITSQGTQVVEKGFAGASGLSQPLIGRRQQFLNRMKQKSQKVQRRQPIRQATRTMAEVMLKVIPFGLQGIVDQRRRKRCRVA